MAETPTIYVDADASPAREAVEAAGQRLSAPVVFVCDTTHIIAATDWAEVRVVDKGADSVDFFITSNAKRGDIVVTDDYGLAAMVMAKGCHAVSSYGRTYTEDGIESLLMKRHIVRKLKRQKGGVRNLKGLRKKPAKKKKPREDRLEGVLRQFVLDRREDNAGAEEESS